MPTPTPTIGPKVRRPVVPQGTCPTSWQFVANMPVDVYGAACASDGTSIYCAGGYSFHQAPHLLNAFNRYDRVTNTWTKLAPMPNGSTMAGAVYYPPTNKIYVFGGGDGFEVIYNFNQIYDIASNTWTTGTSLPGVRAFMAYGYNPGNGKIYLVGGYNTAFEDSGQPDTWEYDPVTDTYTNKADFPELAGGYASGIINGHLYVAGGRDANNFSLNTVWDYNIAADTWTQKNNMPGARNNVRGSAVALDSLFVFGGGGPFGSGSNATNVYLPATDEWRTATNLNETRGFTSGAAVGSNLFAVGGYGGVLFDTLASVEELAASIPEPTPNPCQYSITLGTDTIVPGDTDIGNHCDDCETLVPLPFCFQLYNQTFTSVNVSSNGRLDFVAAHEPFGSTTRCLPAYDFTIFALWKDQLTNAASGCASLPNGTCGVFTSVSGSAPNRIFNIEWRTVLYADPTQGHNFEVRLYENDPLKKFEVIIGVAPSAFSLYRYVSGVQGDSAAGFFTQDFCTYTPPQNVSRIYTSTGCGSPTPTPTATPTPTPTATPGGSCPPTITQSTSQEIVSDNSAACNNGISTAENHYWRAFDMNTFTGGQAYNITSVDFGIELAQSGTGTGQPVTVNLYTNHGSPFPEGDWQGNLIATSGSINIPDQSLTIFTLPISVTVPAGTLELIMEVFTPNGQAQGNLFFVGSNADPETGLSYLSAAECVGAPVPLSVVELGLPNMHMVFNVNGRCSRATPRPRPTPHPRPTPPG
jgi:N-acetylneuraminic acid mutarotase